MKTLIIEDNPKIISAISLAFKISWPDMEIVSSNCGLKGLELLEDESPDVVILDLGLPDISGFEVIEHIRLLSQVPILVLTVSTAEEDIVRALELGANEYVFKPFRQMELIARLRAILRERFESEKGFPLKLGELTLYYQQHKTIYNGVEIKLTATEATILYQLIKANPNIVTYSALSRNVWGDDYHDSSHCLKVHIQNLRNKIERGNTRLIYNNYGSGVLYSKTRIVHITPDSYCSPCSSYYHFFHRNTLSRML